jgi:hypothetical protein
MRLVRADLIAGINAAQTPQDLYPYLQAAIEIEFATIPVYLTGLFTVNANADPSGTVAAIMTSVVNEEMLHLCIAANTLIALGGSPSLTGAVPSYPGPLPYGTDDDLTVNLAPISSAVVLGTYMAIEEPDTPIVQPSSGPPIPLKPPAPPPPGEYASIGAFYEALITKIQSLPANSWETDTSNQVTGVFYDVTPNLPTPIANATDAVAQLNIIIDQGEGTSSDPWENVSLDGSSNDPAHFYRFAQIYMGAQIDATPPTYTFGGAAIPLVQASVSNMFPNPTLAQMQSLLPAADYATCEAFSAKFTTLVEQLQSAFNGSPNDINDAVNTMFKLPSLAASALAITLPDGVHTAGLCFELTAS